MNRSITELPNLGPRCAEWLAQIGIHDEEGLRVVGAPAAFRELVIRDVAKPHRMLLYAMGAALEDTSCMTLSRARKKELADETGLY